MTLTPEERRIEDATVLYVKAGAWPVAVGLFALLAEREPDNANAWFGIGSALWRLSLDNSALLEPAVAALKRSVGENERYGNKTFKQTLLSASQSASKAGLNPDTIAPFSGNAHTFVDLVGFSPQSAIDATRRLEWDARARLVSLLSEVKGELFDTLLQDIADHDSNPNVRTAAARALRERQAVPVPPPSANARATALPAQETPTAAEVPAEPVVTMAENPAPEVTSALPNIGDMLAETHANAVESRPSAETPESSAPPVESLPAMQPSPEAPESKPIDDADIRAQLEARKKRLLGGSG
ncbi:MAG: hypothetical protein HXY40_01085 [Chloroflexi bacterium]|nr:hypothetical protein [Chloroflexota bacterium]